MFVTAELDSRNTYIPNLDDIQEAAKRTYDEAKYFFKKEQLFLKYLEDCLENDELNEEDIYDCCNGIASDLAKCCEMYLKALYIYENQNSDVIIDDIWKELRKKDYETDEKGNRVYKNAENQKTFLRYDDNGNPITDEKGNNIYFDSYGKEYKDNEKGQKIEISAHQLDRLINLISPKSRGLLEVRMLKIPKNETENNNNITIVDYLLEQNSIQLSNSMSKDEYDGWIEQHKRTYEEARYSGQNHTKVNIEFLYHLTTQIEAVVQYRMFPKENQEFIIDSDELSKLPLEIEKTAKLYPTYLSKDFVELMVNNKTALEKLKKFISVNKPIISSITQQSFYNMFNLMSENEIMMTSYICYIHDNIDLSSYEMKTEDNNIKNCIVIAKRKESMDMDNDYFLNLLFDLKQVIPKEIDSNYLMLMLNIIFKTTNKEYYPIRNILDPYDLLHDGRIDFNSYTTHNIK